MAEFRVTARESATRLESRSGAGVRAVRTADGQAAYLKVTPAALGAQAVTAARRELRFYQDLAPIAPVRTPELLTCADTRDGVALLLAAAGEPRDAASWTAGRWAQLGRELACLHSMPLPTGPDWHRPDALRQALVDPDLAGINAFWAATLPELAALISRRVELADQIEALPSVFTHGDCHPGNIVHAAGSLVFCDWQAAGVGRPGSDLAFLSVRAAPAGVTVPPALLDAYLDGRPGERHALRRALVAEELAILVFLWPPYAAFNSSSGIARVRRRGRDLAGQWFDPPSPH
ncbi:phosphotransferase family protein [Micromonospora sp. NPDC092111]|uniref:phosphotransferase family protein n=1 Tax=Micromonospora sp. NPDC092111 TaxID=3364289 RepID=UPI0037FBAF99